MGSDQDRQRPPARPAWVVNVAMRREQERRLASLNDPRWEWARGLVARRVAVAAWAALVVAVVAAVCWAVQAEPASWLRLALLVVAAAATVPLARVAALIRSQAIRGLLDLPIEQLTERQRRLRERTDRLAGRWSLAVFAVALITLVGTGGRLDGAGGLPMAVVLLGLGLPLQVPTLVAAWIAPDDRAVRATRIPTGL